MTHDEFIYTCQTMMQYGGSFATRIAQAALVADKGNKDRLIAAFPEIFEKYGPTSSFYTAYVANNP